MESPATEYSPADAVEAFTGGPVVEPDLQYEIEQFLYHEARLLDERRYRDWFDLLADDLHYWMPVRMNRTAREQARETTALGEIANFDDDKTGIEWRLKRIETGMAWTEDPPSRTRHLVTNVWARPTDIDNEYDVQSYFMLYRNRDETTVDVLVGRRDDRLRRVDGSMWKVAKRRILLDQNVLLSGNLSFFF